MSFPFEDINKDFTQFFDKNFNNRNRDFEANYKPNFKPDFKDFEPDFSEHINISSDSINLALNTLNLSKSEYNKLTIEELKSQRRIDTSYNCILALNILIYYKTNSHISMPTLSPINNNSPINPNKKIKKI